MNNQEQINLLPHIETPKFVEYEEKDKEDIDQNVVEHIAREFNLSHKEAFDFATYLSDLNLGVSDLVQKDVLDIGSAKGNFKKAIQKIVALKHFINFDRLSRFENTDVIGEGEWLPFKDEVFDVVLARHSLPDSLVNTEKEKLISQAIKEMIRVARKGGMVKVYPVGFFDMQVQEKNAARFRMERMVVDVLKEFHQKYPELKMKMTKVIEPQECRNYQTLLEIWK